MEKISRRSFLKVSAVGAAAAALAGCGAASSTAASTPASTAASVAGAATGADAKIGICIYQFADNFMTLYRTDLENDLKALGYTNITIQDGKNDQATQTEQIDTFIADGVNVLIVNLVQATAASTIIEKCKAAGVPVVFINREPTKEDLDGYDKCCYVGADARQSGTFQGEIIAETDNKGDWDGDGVVRYVMIMGDPENVDAQYRTEKSVQALKDAGIEVEELYNQRADWDQAKGQENAANALTQFGAKVDVIFCNNDAMALGALQAIEAAGRTVGKDIYLVGVDALEEAVKDVSEGKMTGTVLNDDKGQASAAVECAVKYLNGEAVDQYTTVDYVKVTPANAAEYM